MAPPLGGRSCSCLPCRAEPWAGLEVGRPDLGGGKALALKGVCGAVGAVEGDGWRVTGAEGPDSL